MKPTTPPAATRHTPEIQWSGCMNGRDLYIYTNDINAPLATVHGTQAGVLEATSPTSATDTATRLVASWNACAGMADPESELATLRRDRDELREFALAVAQRTVTATGTKPSLDRHECTRLADALLARIGGAE